MPRHPRVRDYQAKFENWVYLTCRRTTFRRYATALNAFFSHFPGKKRVKDFTFEDVERYRNLRTSEAISPNTIEFEISVLRAFYNWMLERSIVLNNPTRHPEEAASP